MPISLRVLVGMLERLKAEADQLGIGYQTLLLRLDDAGLVDTTTMPTHVRVPAQLLRGSAYRKVKSIC